jgi:hypothetical protein
MHGTGARGAGVALNAFRARTAFVSPLALVIST